MNTKQKPELSLLAGKDAQNVDMVIKLFEKLKGRPATPQEIADAKAGQPKQSKPPNDSNLSTPNCHDASEKATTIIRGQLSATSSHLLLTVLLCIWGQPKFKGSSL